MAQARQCQARSLALTMAGLHEPEAPGMDETRLPGAAKRLGIGVIRSVGECLDILTQVDTAGQAQPGSVWLRGRSAFAPPSS